jgi:hypothetical protein
MQSGGVEFMDFSSEKEAERYFRELLIDVNSVLRLVPRPLTTAMMASAMPAAIRPYSIAVAPDSSDKKLNNIRFNTASSGFSVDVGMTSCRYRPGT